MAGRTPIDTERFSASLRGRAIDLENQRILLTRFEGSRQEKDLTLPANCAGFGRIHHFRRFQGPGWPPNGLPIDPASRALRLAPTDTMQVQVFQNAICSWRCWYCFVDFRLLSADPRHSKFLSASDLLDLYLAEDTPPRVIDLSGGQPDLVPEWMLWFSDALRERGLERKVYLWSDDNLSNDYLWRYLSPHEIDRLASFANYGRVGCFKGFDEHSFTFNTGAAAELFSIQFRLVKRLLDVGFDAYGYVTFTSDDDSALEAKMSSFVDRLQQEVHPNFPLRTVPLRIRPFTPLRDRGTKSGTRALDIQNRACDAWMAELARRFPAESRAKRICDHPVNTTDVRGPHVGLNA